jgi:hypothetical protein
VEEVKKTPLESCRDCANLEDRRDIEGIALCAMHHGPSVCCQEFTPRNNSVNPENADERFCLNCANYEETGKVPVCARDHRPGIACGAFKKKEELAVAV